MKKNNISEFTIDSIFSDLILNPTGHKVDGKKYLFYKKIFLDYYFDHLKYKKKDIYLGSLGKIKLPFFKMGKINTYNLLGIDELIIFCFYFKRKKINKKAADLGANIGLHSIILDKLGYKIKSFEPDIDHVKQFTKNIKINKCKNIKLINKAIDTQVRKIDFTKILNNTTSSFIGNAKKDFYGPVKKYKVQTYTFNKILKWADLIKIDVEGIEADLILSTKKNDWKNKIAIMEIGNKKNSKKIFYHCKKIGLNIFSQKFGWKKINKIENNPSSYKDGSVILSLSKNNPWL